MGVAIVQQALLDKIRIDRQGRGGEAAGVDGAGAAEDDAVGVDEIDLAFGFDGAENLSGIGGWILDLVECDPLWRIGAAGALIEVKGGLLADIERSPM